MIRVAAANDSGHMVSPDGIANQIEGGIIQSLSWTLKEEVKFDNTRVLSTDWASYPILTFSEVPPVEVVLIDRPGEPYLGTGESAQGPTGAALANAVFDATGAHPAGAAHARPRQGGDRLDLRRTFSTMGPARATAPVFRYGISACR